MSLVGSGCDHPAHVYARIRPIPLEDGHNQYNPAPRAWIVSAGTRRTRLGRAEIRLDVETDGLAHATVVDGRGARRDLRLAPGRHLILILPDMWRLEAGTYAGSVLPTEAILSEAGSTPTLLRRDVSFPSSFPVSVYHTPVPGSGERDREDRAPPVVEALAGINELAGGTVFQLARPSGADADVRVIWSGGSSRDTLGVTHLQVPSCQYDKPRGFSCQPRWIRHADIVLSERGKVAEVQHELLHAIGLSHTCVVPSVMATEFSQADLRACGSARAALGFTAPLRLERRLGRFDAAAIDIVRRAAAALASRHGDYIHWRILHP